MKRTVALILVCAGASACGQKGPLFLPGQPRNAPWPAPPSSPPASAAPAAPAAATAATPPGGAPANKQDATR